MQVMLNLSMILDTEILMTVFEEPFSVKQVGL